VTELVNIKEAAAVLRLKEATIRAWLLKGRLAHVKLGRRVLLRRADLEAIIAAGLVPAKVAVAA
jgi:excisionase family DNA binding protein